MLLISAISLIAGMITAIVSAFNIGPTPIQRALVGFILSAALAWLFLLAIGVDQWHLG